MAAEGEDEIEIQSDTFDESLDFGEIGPGIKITIGRADDIDLRTLVNHGFTFGGFFRTVLFPQPD